MESKDFLKIIIVWIIVILVGFCTYTLYKKESPISGNVMFLTVGGILLFAAGLIIFLYMQKRKSGKFEGSAQMSPTIAKNYPTGSVPKISTTLDGEHQGLFDALDNLYNLALQHFTSEKNLFAEGQAKISSSHQDISGLWSEHEQEHTNFLGRLSQLKQDIISHIENYDRPQFHWT